MKKGLVATLMSLCLLVGLLPMSAFAVDETSSDQSLETNAAPQSVWAGDENGEGTKTNPWDISLYAPSSVTAYLEQNDGDSTSPTYTCYIQGTGYCQNYNNASETPWSTWMDQITKVIVEEGITLTGIRSFSGADALTAVELPSTLTQVNAYTFSSCAALESVTFPKGRAANITIANNAFLGCKSLKEFDFSNVDAFNWDSFSGAGLTKAVFPKSVTSIGASSFYGTPLKRVLIEASESPMKDNSSWPAFGNIAEESIIYVQNDSIFEGHDYSYTHHRTVIANLNGGEFAEGYSYDDEVFVLPQLNEKDGKAFDGWYISDTDVRLEGNIPVKDRAGNWFPAEARWVEGTPDETNIGDIGLILEKPSHFISPAQVNDVTALSPHVAVTGVQWTVDGQPMTTEGFEYGNAYTVAVTVVLEDGYSCSGKGYINETAATVSNGTGSNQYILTYTFPTLEKQEVRVYGDNLTYTGTPRMEFDLGEIHFPSSGISNVTEGTTITMRIYPDRGYGIDEDTLRVYRYTDRTQEIEIKQESSNKYTFVMPSFDVYVPEPTFELQTYSITYEGLVGAVYDQDAYVDSYTVNDTVTLPDPTKEGFIFAGWKVNEEYLEYLPLEDHSGAYTIDKAEDLVLTACWKSTEGVTLHVESFGGGEPIEDVFISDEVLLDAMDDYSYSGSLPALSTAPALKGYEFLFWHVDYMDLAEYIVDLAGIRDSWLLQIQSLRESIESDGDELTEEQLQTYLNVCELGEYSWDHSLLLGNGAAVSSDFSAWYDTIAEQYLDSYISQFSFGKELTYPYPLWYYLALVRLSYGADLPELTIYATYLKDDSIVDHYQLTYESNGGTAYDVENYLDDATATLNKTPMKSDYDFTGWYADSGLTQRVTSLTMNDNKTVYAGWTPQSTDPGTDPGGTTGDSSSSGSSSIKYSISAEAGVGGTISPNGSISVIKGSDREFHINADDGYRIVDVLIDNKSIGSVESYRFENVRENHTIYVTFEKVDQVADPDETGVSDWLNTADHIVYLNGYMDGIFRPDDNMTRAEVAQMFYNLLNDKDVAIAVSFSDVASDAWYAEAVNTLASLGMITGVGDNKYEPDRSITRAEFTAIAMRFADLATGGENVFSDVAEDAWYHDYVVGSIQYGWITGYPDGTFRPENTITRAEVTTIVNRMLGRSADRTFIAEHADELRSFSDVTTSHWSYYAVMEATNAHDFTKDNGVETWNGLSD